MNWVYILLEIVWNRWEGERDFPALVIDHRSADAFSKRQSNVKYGAKPPKSRKVNAQNYKFICDEKV